MARLLLIVGAVVALVALLATTAWFLAYGTTAPREGTLEIAGLTGAAEVAWDDSGRVWVEGPDEVALAAGLGYAHAADHGWTVAIWRQAARGTLAEWFGDEGRALDLHARTLGFASLARRTYAELDEADRAVLDAYARGVSAGFAEPGVVQGDGFLAADVVPGPSDPWDALAAERLHAYLAAPAPAADSTWRRAARADTAVARFLTADSAFRAFLGAPGGGFDRAYALPTGTLVHQIGGGTSALAAIAPVILRTPQRAAVALTTPGTLSAPGGVADGLGWAMLTGSRVRLVPYSGALPPVVHSRIVERDGDETLLAVARDTTGLVLRASRAATDSTAADSSGWRVEWAGFGLGTDLAAFAALRAGRTIPFSIADGAGLLARRGAFRVLGRPTVAGQSGGAVLVAGDTLARYALSVLALRERPSDAPPDTVAADSSGTLRPGTRDVVSGWARSQITALVRGLGARDSLADVLQGPYAYLNGWDGAYAPDAIAPSLFEWWLVAHREFTGHFPDPADSLDAALLPSTLRIARAELRDRYGPLPTDWRWGRLQGGPQFPVLGGRGGGAARRFRDGFGPPGGHPTALRPGPSLVFDGVPAPLAVWTVRTDLARSRVEIRTPALRGAVDAVELAGPEGRTLSLDARAPMPAARLRLTPAS
ncbi:penicillin acylase family protein [Rubrivirga sp. IMCC45206]|uniref:penicillin acylase family protein n=1 Tax=Rubrivirga sp. IMCC45206 TaxID=3391614 RepID=UPI00399023DA